MDESRQRNQRDNSLTIADCRWMWRCRPHDEAHRLPLLDKIHDKVARTIEGLRQKGKVSHLACFPYFPESAATAMAYPTEEALIAYNNPIEMEISSVIDSLKDEGRSFLAIRPLYEGVLTDRFAKHAEVPQRHRLGKEKYADAFEVRERLSGTEGVLGSITFYKTKRRAVELTLFVIV